MSVKLETRPQDVETMPDATPRGLSAADVEERVRRGATNNYTPRVSRTYWNIVADNVFNLFNIVLGTLLIIVIASEDYATAFFAGFSVVTNTFLGMIQEIQAKRKLERLATLSQQKVIVWRDGQQQEIPMQQVVTDDLVVIEPGSRFVVDGVVVRSDAMEVDESLLTGESDAVFKQPDDEVFSGSFCIAGTGLMRATRVGRESNISKLSEIAKEYKRSKTPTQQRIDIIVELTVVIMFVFIPMLFVRAFVDQVTFLDAVRNAVVFVTSLVPQGLVLVAILSLTIGAVKISRHETLVQKVNAVESLANVSVLCFDKTGTLTKNELRVTDVISLTGAQQGTILRDLGHYLNNLAHHNRTAGAVQDYVNEQTSDADHIEKEREIPFNSARKWGAVVLPHKTLVLGAPERILPEGRGSESVHSRALRLQTQGLRVLAFAEATATLTKDDIDIGDQCNPLALIVLSDSVREDINETLDAFRAENISLKVISGDNIETVQAIAKQSGMDASTAYTGAQLDAMSDPELASAVTNANVFARVEPDTKRRIVTALQSQQHYVAMVGDGVNDVPALKQANLAIVMNDGTQISKDVADIVLLNNAMSTLPMAFREGKEITQTIFGTMKMFLVKNFFNVIAFVFVFFMALPFPITPVQISWAAFGTVNLPATLIAFGIVRPKYIANFRDDVMDFIVTGGFIGAVLMTTTYVIAYFHSERDIEVARSAVTIFLTLYSAYIVLSIQGVTFYKPRTFWQNRRIVLLMTVLAALTLLSMYALPSLFEFHTFTWGADAEILVGTTALFMLSMILLAHGLRFRYLVRRMWLLFQRAVRL